MTYNWAQCQSVQKSGLILGKSVFIHDQLCVGLSQQYKDPRTNTPICVAQDEFGHLQLQNTNQNYTRNIVYQEVL